MPQSLRAWSGALTVTVVTAVLVILDVTDRGVHRYWSRHAFTSSVLAGLLVLLMTVLIADRVVRLRQLRNQSRAIAAQAAMIVGQANRTAQAIARAAVSDDDREEAAGELRTYAQMLFTSAALLIEARVSRGFLESAQRLLVVMVGALRDSERHGTDEQGRGVDAAIDELQAAASPLLRVLSPDERAVVSSGQDESAAG